MLGLGTVHALYTHEGLKRALVFWRVVGKMVLHYRFVRWWAKNSDVESLEKEGVYAQLHQRYAVSAVILRRRCHIRKALPY